MAISQIQNRSRGPSQEYLLLDYLQRLGRSLDGRMAVHIHLSRLRPQNRQDHHIRIAAATFEGMVNNYEGQIFVLSNSDLFFICKDAAIEDIDAAIMKRSEEHTSELQSLMRISYAVFCLKKNIKTRRHD